MTAADIADALRRIEVAGRRGADALTVLRTAADGARTPPAIADRIAARWARLLRRLSE
jgi:sugar phosphate isomerase/epimerase